MYSIDYQIHDSFLLSNFINSNSNFAVKADVRYISMHTLAQTTQNLALALVLSKQLHNIEYCQKNVSADIPSEDLEDITYNFEGFIRNAFFINFFVYVENHIRQLAMYFETKPESINTTSILNTFKNLTTKTQTPISLSDRDTDLFEYYCFLRNTMHNGGFQTKGDKKIEIVDTESIYGSQKFELELGTNAPNKISMKQQIILHEQVAKILLKINTQIPVTDFIEHRFTATGFLK